MEVEIASDYGSDFTLDEEEILQSLVQQAPAATFTEELDLVLKDVEDHEGPRGIRIPHFHIRHQQHPSGNHQIPSPKQVSHLTVETADDSDSPARGGPLDIPVQSTAD